MAQNKNFTLAAVALTTTATNILNPPTLTGGTGFTSTATYAIVRHIHVVNVSGSAATFSLYHGASGGTSNPLYLGKSVPANDAVDYYPLERLDTSAYLVALASVAGNLFITIEGEIGIA